MELGSSQLRFEGLGFGGTLHREAPVAVFRYPYKKGGHSRVPCLLELSQVTLTCLASSFLVKYGLRK